MQSTVEFQVAPGLVVAQLHEGIVLGLEHIWRAVRRTALPPALRGGQIWLAKAGNAAPMPAASRALYELRLQWDIYRELLAVSPIPVPALLRVEFTH